MRDSLRPIPRRTFLADVGMGFTGLVFGAMLDREGIARTLPASGSHLPDGKPHFTPKAKSVIWLFMIGGVSHLESFDPKPALDKYAGKSLSETPYKDLLDPHPSPEISILPWVDPTSITGPG